MTNALLECLSLVRALRIETQRIRLWNLRAAPGGRVKSTRSSRATTGGRRVNLGLAAGGEQRLPCTS